MKNWREPEMPAIPDELAGSVGGHPLVAALLVQRGIRTAAGAQAFLYPEKYTPTPPEALPGLTGVAERVIRALEAGEKICVWGDFDVDGQTATALLVEALRALGGDMSHHIPVRKNESHGLNIENLGEIISGGARLILTCDTGTADHAAIEFAASRGADVAVTDHHKLAATPPPAAAFTNPQLLPAGHPLRTLPGVGVAWKLVELLGARLGKPELAERGLDLAALGIVADVAELTGDTRWLLQRGLAALREDRRAGLRELYALAEIDPARIDTETIGFSIAPRLNAIGRLGDANPVVEFLTTGDATRSRVLANRLEGLNGERKLITEAIHGAAKNMLETEPDLAAAPAIVLARAGWEPGVIGLVAARVAEDSGKPAILISLEADGLGRGSARSVHGIDITAAIAAAADLLEGFGGHTMAGGLSIRADRIDEFRRRVAAAVREQLPDGRPSESLSIDGYLGLGEIDLGLVADLDRLAPFGAGNPRPVLASRDLEIRTSARIGRTGDHLRVVVADREEAVQEVLWWGGGGEPQPEGRFDLAYTLGVNSFKGERRVQVTWLAAREIETEGGEKRAGSKLGMPAVIDLRRAEDPAGELNRLNADGEWVVWGRPGEKIGVPSDPSSRPALAIWTIPTGPEILPALVRRFNPETVVLFGNPPPDIRPQDFLRRLAGLLKYAQRMHAGRVPLETLVEATQQSRAAVEAGLEVLSDRGHFVIEPRGNELQIDTGPGEAIAAAETSGRRLKQILDETAAFRRYYLAAPVDRLLEP